MELIMPNNSLEMNANEMAYVDGSWKLYTNWWGLCLKLTKNECSKIALGTRAASLITGNPTALALAKAFSWAASWGAANNGLYINKTWTGYGWVSW
ncbi:hypothetical protein M2475_002245 [Breznakia sp. PF5-3]|uniref:hypothetical protein n=1 Tax=unclassified Breznakia TaxID=2623764 RepID=UPI002404F73D|nr:MULTISPECIES: hypothetical protein [unclassified Breznakia]MDF9825855.1 hypothetical protein [Breznakia sp. PM6-1]MDF9836663.1 hypothetical protein [Breznakia sp. PF5-3]MDF9838698.1 hypothetical protein [Breznakia sp. PFB2-8]MDF9860729.1 hypothetical protein [Breznakia sp. PH5-24]